MRGHISQKVEWLIQHVKILEAEFARHTHKHAIVSSEIDLPDFLRKTWNVIGDKSVTADEVAAITKRARAVESGYLNQFVRLGMMTKERISHKTYFTKTKGGEKNAESTLEGKGDERRPDTWKD